MFAKHTKKEIRRSRRSYRRNTERTRPTSNSIVSYQAPLPIERKLKVGGDKIVVETVLKDKIGELGKEVRAGSPRRMRK